MLGAPWLKHTRLEHSVIATIAPEMQALQCKDMFLHFLSVQHALYRVHLLWICSELTFCCLPLIFLQWLHIPDKYERINFPFTQEMADQVEWFYFNAYLKCVATGLHQNQAHGLQPCAILLT